MLCASAPRQIASAGVPLLGSAAWRVVWLPRATLANATPMSTPNRHAGCVVGRSARSAACTVRCDASASSAASSCAATRAGVTAPSGPVPSVAAKTASAAHLPRCAARQTRFQASVPSALTCVKSAECGCATRVQTTARRFTPASAVTGARRRSSVCAVQTTAPTAAQCWRRRAYAPDRASTETSGALAALSARPRPPKNRVNIHSNPTDRSQTASQVDSRAHRVRRPSISTAPAARRSQLRCILCRAAAC